MYSYSKNIHGVTKKYGTDATEDGRPPGSGKGDSSQGRPWGTPPVTGRGARVKDGRAGRV